MVKGTAKTVPTPAPNIFFPDSPKTNIKPIKLNIAMCPADMLPANLNISVNGLINREAISITANNGFTAVGTPGIQNMCTQ